MMTSNSGWCDLAKRIQAIAQNGLTFSLSDFDTARYRELAGIASEMMAGPEPIRVAMANDLFSIERGYATPKIDVRAAVFQGERLLLVRESEDGCWTLPGGWADVGLFGDNYSSRSTTTISPYRRQLPSCKIALDV
jgi:hypothetical protein